MSELLFEGKRFYIYSPSSPTTTNPEIGWTLNQGLKVEKSWEKEIRHLKHDIEYHGGQIVTSPSYHVQYILIHPTHLREIVGNNFSQQDLMVEIPLEGITSLENWEKYEYGMIPWTLPKIIERFGINSSNGRGKEVVLKTGWVNECLDAQRVLDERYGEFGYAGMRIRSRFAVKAEPKENIHEADARPSAEMHHEQEHRDDIANEALRSITSSPRVRPQEMKEIEGNGQYGRDEEGMARVQNESGVVDGINKSNSVKSLSVDRASHDLGSTYGESNSSVAPPQANNEKWQNDIHAELDRLLGERSETNQAALQAEKQEALNVHLYDNASTPESRAAVEGDARVPQPIQEDDQLYSPADRLQRQCSSAKKRSTASIPVNKSISNPNYRDHPELREMSMRHICRLLLAMPEGEDKNGYLRRSQPMYHIKDWQKSYSRLNEYGAIDKMVQAERAKRLAK